ncbi:MAG TPA: hypothetical protein VGM37_07080 [Armatimonadota bacterium]|jgi:hypothetical protein
MQMTNKWMVVALTATMAGLPALAQTDMATSSSSSSSSNMSAMSPRNVDTAKVRDWLTEARGLLERIHDNNRLAASAGDTVQADGYNGNSEILLDNASARAMSALDALGTPFDVPRGWGAIRAYVAMLDDHLAHARLMCDYTVPVDQAKEALDNALQLMDTNSSGMMGSNMSGSYGAIGMRTTDTTTTPNTTATSSGAVTPDTSGTPSGTATPDTSGAPSGTVTPDTSATPSDATPPSGSASPTMPGSDNATPSGTDSSSPSPSPSATPGQ